MARAEFGATGRNRPGKTHSHAHRHPGGGARLLRRPEGGAGDGGCGDAGRRTRRRAPFDVHFADLAALETELGETLTEEVDRRLQPARLAADHPLTRLGDRCHRPAA